MGEAEEVEKLARKTTTKRTNNVGKIRRVLAMLIEEEEGEERWREEREGVAMEV